MMTQRKTFSWNLQPILAICVCFLISLCGNDLRAQDTAQKPLPKKQPAETIEGPPIVTAKAWGIADGKTGKLLWGSHQTDARQMASTTKIMTAWLVLQLAKDNPKLLDETITVSENADKTGGSSARIVAGETYTARNMLFGLLLPSGNDAAVALAEHFGTHFQNGDKEMSPLKAFVAKMNEEAKKLGMEQTKYLDPHGNSRNQSSARDLSILAWHALQNPVFRKYVQTRQHQCDVTNAEGKSRTAVWNNTNRLLGREGYDGVKTGTTGGAGRCLVASGRHNSDHLIIVVLGCTSQDSRYVDTRNLFRWAWRQRANAK